MVAIFSLILFFIFLFHPAYTQVSLNTDGSQPDPSAIFDIKSSSKGILLPRMTFCQRDSIISPAEGLIVFCTNCGLNGSGALSLFTGGEWYTMSLCKISVPTPGLTILLPSAISWKWNSVTGAVGYKWSTTNSFETAFDLESDTSIMETGITCDTVYSRYVWAYNDCAYSVPLTLTQFISECWNCGDTVPVNHIAGDVAPVNKTTIYLTVTNVPGETTKCWITSNLGSDHQATSVNDATEASAGWYWQFNSIQGYKHDGTVRTPNTTWISSISESSNWVSAHDPCTLELGYGWRIPTKTEWENIDVAGNWIIWTNPWNSPLKLHAAGRLHSVDGALGLRGSEGIYQSSTQSLSNSSWRLYFSASACAIAPIAKSYGFSVRCIKD